MKTIKLSNGFECEINEHVIHDMRFIKLVKQAQSDSTVITDIVDMLFGEQEDKLCESIQMDDGTIPVDRIDGCEYSLEDAVMEVINALGTEGKN